MDQELVTLLRSPDRDKAAKGAEMLASFLARASFPSKSVQALREVIPPQPLQRILSALSLRLAHEMDEFEVSKSLHALLLLLQSEEVRDTVLSVGDASLVELCRDLISGLSRVVRMPNTTVGMTAVAVFGSVCQSDKARQLLLQHSDTEPIFERIPQLLSDLPESSSIPLSVAYLTRYPSAQRRVLASGRCAKLLAGLNQLMLSADFRVASDAACAVGNLAFNDEGRYQVLAYKELNDVVSGLTHILKAPEELAGNAAWAIGNLSRDEAWCRTMLGQGEWVEEVLQGLGRLVQSSDVQAACDAACALGSLVASEKGRALLLAHWDVEGVVASLLHNVQLSDPLVAAAAALALHRVREPGGEGKELVMRLEAGLGDAARSKVATVMTNLDLTIAVNAATLMRGLPTTSPGGLAPVSGVQQSGGGGAQEGLSVRRDVVCVKSWEGAVLRSLPIQLFTTEAVAEDAGAAGESGTPQVVAGQGKENGGRNGVEGGGRAEGARGGAAAVKGRGDVEGEGGDGGKEKHAGRSGAGGEKEAQDPAPAGLVVRAVELEAATEASLRVCWRPACAERTQSCRFVCDSGNGGHYRNVCTLAREECGEDGAYRCTIGDLLPGREYRVLAIARTSFKPCHGALTMFDTKGVFRTEAAAPAPPEKPVLSSRTRTQLKIRWVPPDQSGAQIASYEVHMCRAAPAADGEFVEESAWEPVHQTASSKDTSWKANKLSPGQHYGFVVRAVNTKGPGAFSAPAFYSTSASVPSAPARLWVGEEPGEAQGGKLALAWEAAACNGDPVSSYVLEQDDALGGAFSVIYNGPSTGFVASGLMAGRAHKFRVKAANGEGQGQYSPVLEAAGASGPPAACDAPTLVKAKPTALAIKWSEPDCRGSEIRSYRVMVGEEGRQGGGVKEGGVKFRKAWQGSDRACEVVGLQPGQRYSVKVMAINSVGEGEAGPSASFETGADAPSPPLSLAIVSKGAVACKLRWKAPAASNGATVTGYRVELEDVADGNTRTINVAGQTQEYEVNELLPERGYNVRLRAINKVGASAPTEPLRLTPSLAPPGPPGMPRLISAKATSLTIRWDPPMAGAVEGYRVEVQLESSDGYGKFVNSEVHGFKTDEPRAELTGLRPVTSYRVRVVGRNKSGFGEKGPAGLFRTEAALAPPTRLQTTLTEGDGLVALCQWERPEGHTATTQLTYHMEVDEGGEGSADFAEVYVGPHCQHALPLKPGKSYKFRVRAVSSAGSSAWSVIKGFSRAVPGAGVPENVAVRWESESSAAVLTWSPPAAVAAGAYQVKVDLQEGKKRRDVEGFEYRRDDLEPGPHRFQLRAMVNGKWSEWSREALLVVPETAAPPGLVPRAGGASAMPVGGEEVGGATGGGGMGIGQEAASGGLAVQEQVQGGWGSSIEMDLSNLLGDDLLGGGGRPAPVARQEALGSGNRQLPFALMESDAGQMGHGEVGQGGMQAFWPVSDGVGVGVGGINQGIGGVGAMGMGSGVGAVNAGGGGEEPAFFLPGQRGRLFGGDMVGGVQGERVPGNDSLMEVPVGLSGIGLRQAESEVMDPPMPPGGIGLPVGFSGSGMGFGAEGDLSGGGGFGGVSGGELGLLGGSVLGGGGVGSSGLGRSGLRGGLGGVVGSGLGGSSIWGNGGETDELIASIPTGLFDELDGGEGLEANGSGGVTPPFYLQKETSSSSSASTSRFSLWGMPPLDPAPPLETVPASELLPPHGYSAHPSFSEPASFVGFGTGAAAVGGHGLGNGERLPGPDIARGVSSGVSAGAALPNGAGVVGSGVGPQGLGVEQGGAEGESDGVQDGHGAGEVVGVRELVRELVEGTTFSEGDVDGKHREMLAGLWRGEAEALLEALRPQLQATDKAALRDTGAFMHGVLLRGRQLIKRQGPTGAGGAGGAGMGGGGAGGQGAGGFSGGRHGGVGRGSEELSGKAVKELMDELVAGTSLEGLDVKKAGASGLAGVSGAEAGAVLRAAQGRLARALRVEGGQKAPGALLQSVLAAAKDEVRRGKRPGEGEVGPSQQTAPGGGEGGAERAGSGYGQGGSAVGAAGAGELQGCVRKAIRELASQTCFEEGDFERAHVSLLAGMAPAVACQVLRTIKARLAKTKRREHRAPAAFLFGALTSAARAAVANGHPHGDVQPDGVGRSNNQGV